MLILVEKDLWKEPAMYCFNQNQLSNFKNLQP